MKSRRERICFLSPVPPSLLRKCSTRSNNGRSQAVLLVANKNANYTFRDPVLRKELQKPCAFVLSSSPRLVERFETSHRHAALFTRNRFIYSANRTRIDGGPRARPVAQLFSRTGVTGPGLRSTFLTGQKVFPSFNSATGRRHDERGLKGGEQGTVILWTCGLDQISEALELLLATVIVVPSFRFFKISPVLGFLLAGILLGPHGFTVVHDYRDINAYAEFGVLFLLFEMGLELSVQRLRQLAKFVFGYGNLQVAITTVVMGGIAKLMGAPTLEALVVGNALSLSSSAFVLQLLRERGELAGRFGQVSFAVLLLQDIAVVPLLVVLPLLGDGGGTDTAALLSALGIATLKGLAALVGIVLTGQFVLSPVFQAVAGSRSPDAFVAMILLTVLGTAYATDEMGLSDSLGAFMAGALLADTKFRFQIEADIQAARGLLLGLFFMTVGFSMDLGLAFRELPTVVIGIVGLITIKATILTLLGRVFGLDWSSSARTGLLLSQGGEFSFVIFAQAKMLGILPSELNSLLIVIVAFTMALTPLLAEAGTRVAMLLENENTCNIDPSSTFPILDDRVLICGYGPVGETVGRMFSSCLQPFVAFDIDPVRVTDLQKRGLPVLYGDASRPEVLEAAGLRQPKAAVVTVRNFKLALRMVTELRRAYPDMPIFVRARSKRQQRELTAAGASTCVPELLEASLQLGASVLMASGFADEEVTGVLELTRRSEDIKGDAKKPLGRRASV